MRSAGPCRRACATPSQARKAPESLSASTRSSVSRSTEPSCVWRRSAASVRARRRSSRSSSAMRSRSARASSASATASRRRARTSLSSSSLRSSSLAARCAATPSLARKTGPSGVQPQRPRTLGALGRIGERDDDAPLGDVEPHDARGEDVVALGLERGRAVRQRHEGVRAGQQLHLVAIVAAAPHAHAHDIAGAGLLGDRGDLVGLERLQVEPRRAVRGQLAHAGAHPLTETQHVVARVHEAPREIAGAHTAAAVLERERGRACIQRDDVAVHVVADREVPLDVRVLDAQGGQQAALGLALAPFEGVDARVH